MASIDSVVAGMQQKMIEKLNKSGRTWKPVQNIPYHPSYRNAELFCEHCGKSVGVRDIFCTDLKTGMYCADCTKAFVRPVPYDIADGVKVVFDNGCAVDVEYTDSYYEVIRVSKTCYYGKKGRYIKIKGKQNYLNAGNPYMSSSSKKPRGV